VNYLRQQFTYAEIFFPSDTEKLMEFALQYIPVEFSWWIFWAGQILILAGIGLWGFSHKNVRNHNR